MMSSTPKISKEQHLEWVSDPANYKFKFIYVNASDPRIWVTKPSWKGMYMGEMLNLAHKESKKWLCALLFIPILIFLAIYVLTSII